MIVGCYCDIGRILCGQNKALMSASLLHGNFWAPSNFSILTYVEECCDLWLWILLVSQLLQMNCKCCTILIDKQVSQILLEFRSFCICGDHIWMKVSISLSIFLLNSRNWNEKNGNWVSHFKAHLKISFIDKSWLKCSSNNIISLQWY